MMRWAVLICSLVAALTCGAPKGQIAAFDSFFRSQTACVVSSETAEFPSAAELAADNLFMHKQVPHALAVPERLSAAARNAAVFVTASHETFAVAQSAENTIIAVDRLARGGYHSRGGTVAAPSDLNVQVAASSGKSIVTTARASIAVKADASADKATASTETKTETEKQETTTVTPEAADSETTEVGAGELTLSFTSESHALPQNDYVVAEIVVSNTGTEPLGMLTITAGNLMQDGVTVAKPTLLSETGTEVCNAQWIETLAAGESAAFTVRWYADEVLADGKAMTSVSVSAENGQQAVNRSASLFYEKSSGGFGRIGELLMKYGLLFLAAILAVIGLFAVCRRLEDE